MFIRLLKNLIKSSQKTNMEKEIYSQPDIVSFLVKKYIKKGKYIDIKLPDNIKRIALIASGSSYHSATIAANFIRENAHCDAQSFYASEVAILNSIDVDSETLYIFISQSGETSDTNNALEKIKLKTNKTLAISNTKNSTLYNNVQYRVLTYAGIEKSIASTKAMCAQMYCLFLISLKIMQEKGLPIDTFLKELVNVPNCIKSVFTKKEEIKKYSKILSEYDNAAVLASGMFYPLAKESALKIKETSYINTTAYPTGEFLHGHIAILNKKCAVIAFVNNHNIDFTMNVLNKVNTNYKTDTLIISAFPLYNLTDKTVINLSASSEINFMFSSLILLQLLAFETAYNLKRNIDKPNGLTKVV